MSDYKLPIDLIPSALPGPPRFRWQQVVSTPVGDRVVDNEGTLPPTVEVAVTRLIFATKQLRTDNIEMRRLIDELTARVAAQSELLSRKAESPPTPAPAPAPTPAPQSSRKVRG